MSKNIKIILVVLTVVIALGVSLFIWNSNQSKTKTAGSILKETPKTTTQANNTPAVIILSASKPAVKVGESFAVSINISSRKPSDGTDIILLYDPNLLSVESTSGKPVSVGSIYPEYPINSDDKKGRIVVSGISSSPEGIIASGLFGTVTFKAKTAGKTIIKLDFTKGSTTDSNVTESGTSSDILEAVQNADVLIY